MWQTQGKVRGLPSCVKPHECRLPYSICLSMLYHSVPQVESRMHLYVQKGRVWSREEKPLERAKSPLQCTRGGTAGRAVSPACVVVPF